MDIQEKILQIARNLDGKYFTAKQLRGILGVKSTEERQAVSQALANLRQSCEIVFDERNKRYRVTIENELGSATLECNARGFGFLIREEGDDLFVPASKMGNAFHGDKVIYRRVEGTADEAEIVRVVERGIKQVVGTYDRKNNARFVIPDDKRFTKDVRIPPKRDLNAKNGQKVVAQINVYPLDRSSAPEGEIVQVLGFPDDKNVDMLSVAAAYGLRLSFDDEVERRADKIADRLTEEDYLNRRDLRGETIFTIDGEDAKDLDDAVSIVDNEDGTYNLKVHIADVSHYVKPNDEIDKEAFARGTSVYFPEMVFPMLPRKLSNGICSLYEGVDRLTLTCDMTINVNGKVVDADIYQSVINSRHRMTYDAVQAIFDGDEQLARKYSDITTDLFVMKRLAEILQNKRNRRGNIEFATKEVTFAHDDEGRVVDVIPCENGFSHQLIEEFMIVANETVADYARNCDYPFVYRVHDKPDGEKLAVLFALLKGLGINVKQSKQIHNTILRDALMQARQTPYFNLVNNVMLRTMQKAKYSEVNSGHFGLASDCYCHFTSPIRRYPDLIVHRVLTSAILGKMTDKAVRAYSDMACQGAKQSNVREKLADEAERKADDVKKCAYAETVIGQTFTARISGVTERGIYAELNNTVEGFIPVGSLGGYFQYNPQLFCLFNDAQKYSLGDEISIKVAGVNKATCKIDFLLADDCD